MAVRYSVVGLGKLGASMAAAIASRGYEVVGVDVDAHAVQLMKDGRAPVSETGLEETIAANRNRLRATLSHEDAVLNSDVTFVVVPTPSDDRGGFAIHYAAEAFRAIGRALAKKRSYHTVVLTSTVLPGATRHGLLPVLEREAQRPCGETYGLCYSPVFVALGSVIRDFLNPDFTLIGQGDERSGSELQRHFDEMLPCARPTRRMTLENAELAKLAVNNFITTKITFANMLADLCERLPGGDVDAVCDVLGLDPRIGRKCLTGALGYGGPCFPRDNLALSFIARALGTRAVIAEATDQANRTIGQRIAERLGSLIDTDATVAVLGLAYKPYSYSVEQSQGLYLAQALSRAGARVVAYDPRAGEAARLELGSETVVVRSLKECLAHAQVVVITTPDPEFRALTAADLAMAARPVTVVDCWRILRSELSTAPNVRYIPLGSSVDDTINAARVAELWTEIAIDRPS